MPLSKDGGYAKKMECGSGGLNVRKERRKGMEQMPRLNGVWRAAIFGLLAAVHLFFLCLPALAEVDVKGQLFSSGDNAYKDRTAGWLRLTATNQDNAPAAFSLTVRDTFNDGIKLQIKGQVLAPRESRVYNVPVLGSPFRSIDIQDLRTGKISHSYTQINPGNIILHLAPKSGWAQAAALDAFNAGLSGFKPTTSTVSSTGTTTATLKHSSHSSPPSSPRELVSQMEPASLPENWACYLNFSAVFLSDSTFKALKPEESEALLTWTRMGGFLLIYDCDKYTREKLLLGTLQRQTPNPLEQKITANYNGWHANRAVWDVTISTNANPPYEKKETASHMGALSLATLFCLLAGPGNYIYCRRKKSVHLILFTLPALSIVFCLIIAGQFILTKGFSRFGQSLSITLLDQGTNDAVTLSRHILKSGLYPLGGFHFQPQTALYVFRDSGAAKQYSMDLTRDQHLTNGLFIPSVPFDYTTVLPFKTRERLVLDEKDMTVMNGFEKPVNKLVLLIKGGQWFEAADIAPGMKAKLTPLTPPSPASAGAAMKELPEYFASRYLKDTQAGYVSSQKSFCSPNFSTSRARYMLSFEKPLPSAQPGVEFTSGQTINLLLGSIPE